MSLYNAVLQYSFYSLKTSKKRLVTLQSWGVVSKIFKKISKKEIQFSQAVKPLAGVAAGAAPTVGIMSPLWFALQGPFVIETPNSTRQKSTIQAY